MELESVFKGEKGGGGSILSVLSLHEISGCFVLYYMKFTNIQERTEEYKTSET